MEANQIQEINRLRSLNLSPKEIARSLKLRPAEVKEILLQQAAAIEIDRVESGEIDPLYQCVVNSSATMLLNHDGSLNETSGFAQIFIARNQRMKLSVCSYLVDYWCLEVKDAFGPRRMSKYEYESMVGQMSDKFNENFVDISIEQAQSIVWGAVDYAAKLGIEPHPDFIPAQSYLGTRLDTLLPIEFGKDGKPFYISGPYDNPEKIMAQLNRSAGEGNYDFIMGIEDL